MGERSATLTTIDRRRLLKLAGVTAGQMLALSLVSACRRGNPTPIEPTTATTTVAVAPTPPRPTPTRPATTPTPVPTRTRTTATPTPAQAPFLIRGGFFRDPSSHDFNANVACGGDPSLWSGLLTLDTGYTPVADWATKWEPNQDASRWTFHLRPNNTGWSNGDAVSAQDFVWSWQRTLAPKTSAPQAWMLYDIQNAEPIHRGEQAPDKLGVRALDRWTLEVDLVGPRAYFPAIAASVATVPAYRPAVEKYGDHWTEPGSCVSNGPFRLTAWQHGARFDTAPSATYWNAPAIRLDRTIVPILDPAKGPQPYYDNQVDFLPVQPADLVAARANSSFGADLSPAVLPSVWFLITATTTPPLDDVRVRRALAHAIDRERLVQISQGQARAAQSLMPLNFASHFDDPDIVALQRFDVDAALQALAGTPYEGGKNWPALSLAIADTDAPSVTLSQDVAQQLFENLGVTVEVKRLSTADYDAALANHGAHLFWYRWDLWYADPHDGYADAFFPSGDGPSRFPVPPSGLTGMLDRARGEQNAQTRLGIYRDCERLLQDQVAYIPLAYPVTFYLVHPWVRGFPTARDLSLLAPSLLFTRLTSLVTVQNRPGP